MNVGDEFLKDEFCNMPENLSFNDVRSTLVISENKLREILRTKKLEAIKRSDKTWIIKKQKLIAYIINNHAVNIL